MVAVKASFEERKAKYITQHDKARQARTQRPLVTGEKCYYLTTNDKWQLCIITGTRDTGRTYETMTEEGPYLRRNRSYLKPRSFDIPVINKYFTLQDHHILLKIKSSSSYSGLLHPPKNNIVRPPYPPKVKMVLTCTGNGVYQFIIPDTLVLLKISLKKKKMIRFQCSPVNIIKLIPARQL